MAPGAPSIVCSLPALSWPLSGDYSFEDSASGAPKGPAGGTENYVPDNAAAAALSMVVAVRHDPDQRLSLASSFYDDRTDRVSIRSYRRAELAFMRWQVSRGVLASPDSSQPGSEWWRQVNEGLLRDAWEADRLVAGRPGSASRPSVSRWAELSP